MATQYALTKLSTKCKLLGHGFSEHNNPQRGWDRLPQALIHLYTLYYFESDKFVNTNDQTATHSSGTQSHFFGEVQLLYINQPDTIIYQWKLQIQKCTEQQISIGIINEKSMQQKIDNQEYWLYHTMQPFNMWVKSQTIDVSDEIFWKKIGDYDERQKMSKGDIITLQIKMQHMKKTMMRLVRNDESQLLNCSIKLRQDNKYRLYIFMYGRNQNQITIQDFKSIYV